MTRNRRYIVTRNGEHVAEFNNRENAEQDIATRKADDPRLAQQGWITWKQLQQTRYNIEIH